MRNLVSFIQMSLDGYFADANGGISWPRRTRTPNSRPLSNGTPAAKACCFSAGLHTKDGQLLAIPNGAEVRSVGGREHELPAEDRIFENPRPRRVEPCPPGERRSGSGDPQAEKGRRERDGDFAGIRKNLALRPTITRTFRNGSVWLCYQPAP